MGVWQGWCGFARDEFVKLSLRLRVYTCMQWVDQFGTWLGRVRVTGLFQSEGHGSMGWVGLWGTGLPGSGPLGCFTSQGCRSQWLGWFKEGSTWGRSTRLVLWLQVSAYNCLAGLGVGLLEVGLMNCFSGWEHGHVATWLSQGLVHWKQILRAGSLAKGRGLAAAQLA